MFQVVPIVLKQKKDSIPSSNSRQLSTCKSQMCKCNTGESNQITERNQLDILDMIEKLRQMNKVCLNRTRIVRKTMGFLNDSGIVEVQFEVLDEDKRKMFEIEIQQGDLLEEFGIKIFDIISDTLLCYMNLESNLEIKNLVLRIYLPPKTYIGSVFEMRGLSKTACIKDKHGETVYHVYTNIGLSGFGWTTSAKILNREGNEKLGDININKQQGNDSFSITINFPPTFETNNKVLILGACLILIKDY